MRAAGSSSSVARGFDVAAILLLLVAVSVVIGGGFRESTPLGRISVTTWWRPLAVSAAILLLRSLIWPTIPLYATLGDLRRWVTSVDVRLVWPTVAVTRLGVLLVGFLGIVLLGYAPHTPPYRIYDNDFLDMPARWDSGWYMGIASTGYAFDPARVDAQQNIAFFPAYPLLMRYTSLLIGREVLWAGVIVSLVSFLLAAVYLVRLAREYMPDGQASFSVALLAAYPFALFFSTAYTESLFLLTILATCWHFERGALGKAAAWGFIAGLTRPNGCLLSVVLAAMLVFRRRHTHEASRLPSPSAKGLAVAAMPGLGMLCYSAYIYSLTGHPFQWAAQNAAWGRAYKGIAGLVGERMTFIAGEGLYAYAATQSIDWINAAAVIFALCCVWPVYRRFGVPYALMIVVTVLPPLVLGGFLSMGRITSTLFPIFLWLGAAVPERQRGAWLMGFAMMQALCAIVFFTWRPLY